MLNKVYLQITLKNNKKKLTILPSYDEDGNAIVTPGLNMQSDRSIRDKHDVGTIFSVSIGYIRLVRNKYYRLNPSIDLVKINSEFYDNYYEFHCNKKYFNKNLNLLRSSVHV